MKRHLRWRWRVVTGWRHQDGMDVWRSTSCHPCRLVLDVIPTAPRARVGALPAFSTFFLGGYPDAGSTCGRHAPRNLFQPNICRAFYRVHTMCPHLSGHWSVSSSRLFFSVATYTPDAFSTCGRHTPRSLFPRNIFRAFYRVQNNVQFFFFAITKQCSIH
jgi:hypothetical protein